VPTDELEFLLDEGCEPPRGPSLVDTFHEDAPIAHRDVDDGAGIANTWRAGRRVCSAVLALRLEKPYHAYGIGKLEHTSA
jgi:hypothetical protein